MSGKPTRSRQTETRAELFDQIPSGIALISPELRILDHNRAFGQVFGEGCGLPCYTVTKGRPAPCTACPAKDTFADGRQRVIEQAGTDRSGRRVHYLVQVCPVTGADGTVESVATITTDLTATRRLQREYQTLFERVPCFVAVINRDHRVVKANEAFRKMFGEPTGESCYRLYKHRHEPCPGCPVDQTFSDGGSHTSHQMGVSQDGRPTPYVVVTAPLVQDDGEVSHVIEMALDLTEHEDLEERLGRASAMRLALVESALDAIVILDEGQRVVQANRATEELFAQPRAELEGRRALARTLPAGLGGVLRGAEAHAVLPEAELTRADGELVPVRLAAVRLESAGRFLGSAVFAQDLRELRRLEQEKLDAERLAAVGQTVAGLAHGIKNIITGLEGGMYVTSSGMKRGDQERVRVGWEMLARNISRISELSKNLLAFSRGERLTLSEIRPAAVVREVVELYRDGAGQHGIRLEAEVDDGVAPAFMDGEGLHSCVANLVANAVDACLVSDSGGCRIGVHLHEEEGTIVVEVTDTGCGMDYEIKQKVFTSFFTTKGRGGTGLGLLLTRKIVQQHGGTIELDSEPGRGTTFRLRFPRARLPRQPKPEEDHEPEQSVKRRDQSAAPA